MQSVDDLTEEEAALMAMYPTTPQGLIAVLRQRGETDSPRVRQIQADEDRYQKWRP